MPESDNSLRDERESVLALVSDKDAEMLRRDADWLHETDSKFKGRAV